jgi:phospholipid/cholesterol/gamma-HCH transport system ATP-binding protein
MIRLIDVHKAFGEKEVLKGFTLEVNEGETAVIIGYSGTGKSVAIKHIVGLLEPDQGTVWVDGLEVPKLSRPELYALRAKIGYVFQFAALFDSMTIGENVAMGLRKEGKLAEREIQARVSEALELVDLPNVETKMPAELSGGMRKRVGIARAIARRPKYILYDEPTTGLDPVTSAVIDELMVRMREKLGVTSIVITHDMRSAYRVGSRIAMLYEGTVRHRRESRSRAGRRRCLRTERSTRLRSCRRFCPTRPASGRVPLCAGPSRSESGRSFLFVM